MAKDIWTFYYTLDRPSPLEAFSQINGLKVEVHRNSNQVVIGNVDASDMDEARKEALAAANQFLNTLSWKQGTSLKIEPETYSAYHVSPSGKKEQILKAAPVAVVTSVGELTAVKKDAAGNIVEVRDSQKPGRIDTKPSDAAAYYRRAHLTSDPFDSFRNLYLAVENIADRIRIKKTISKQRLKKMCGLQSYERSLLQIALHECFAKTQQSLVRTASKTYTIDTKKPIIPQLAEILYEGNRCQLNHAKALENKKIPFNPQDEKAVKTALCLMELVAKSLLAYEDNLLP